MQTIIISIGAFIFFLLLAFIAGLIVSFAACRHAADTVYPDAEGEQQMKRFAKGTQRIDKFLS